MERYPLEIHDQEKQILVSVGTKADVERCFEIVDGLNPVLSAVEHVARGLVADVHAKEGASQIKSMARKIAGVKTRLDDIGKEIVAELKERPKKIDANRRAMRDRLEKLEDEIRRPVTEIEGLQARIAEMAARHTFLSSATPEAIDAETAKIMDMPNTADEWKESLDDFRKAREAELKALATVKAAAVKREAEARELERLRAENERMRQEQEKERIRKEAAEQAKKEAERKAAAELEASRLREENARREAQEARRQAEQLRTEQEASRQQKAPQKPQEAAQPAMESRWSPKAVEEREEKERRKVMNREAAEDIASIILNAGERDVAKAVAAAIIKGEVRHVTMDYENQQEED